MSYREGGRREEVLPVTSLREYSSYLKQSLKDHALKLFPSSSVIELISQSAKVQHESKKLGGCGSSYWQGSNSKRDVLIFFGGGRGGGRILQILSLTTTVCVYPDYPLTNRAIIVQTDCRSAHSCMKSVHTTRSMVQSH